ncbi:conserved hypothetical protein [Theileria orientalis strain Shintoku]|uniref:Uncharacterized protein n=1 Tax=Theileria orientalis strain Shintoku TaxID=869250 RepID=J4C366_THEOR|nr:conserved hypothetical protein [Theileria orientalis strain Shintoku]BAM39906.1 conserved hypothetical protein [Theileria orientalis strain Shintoku]|eukprot:XP_009690207.1 conserved hypothetical protein [Theileria orientalis strain Shintoku]
MEIELSENDLINTPSFGNKAPSMSRNVESSKEPFSIEKQLAKDPETLQSFSEDSRSVSFADDDDDGHQTTKDLIKDCPFCYTPTRKWVANINQFDAYLFIFLLLWVPYVSRFTFQTSYLHYTESQPSLRSTKENLLLYLCGVAFGLLMSVSEFFKGVKVLVDMYSRKKFYPGSADSYRDSYHRGALVLHATRSGFPLWTTKNNVLAAKRPVSFLKWAYRLTISEFFLHAFVVSRWLAAFGLFGGTFFTISVISLIAAKGLNDSFHYIFIIHFINGLTIPLVFVYVFKLLYKFISCQVKSILVKRKGLAFDDPVPTRNGKTFLERPVFAFLGDSCPCTFAVDASSKLPRSYRYSIRYHCVFNGFNKLIFFSEVAVLTLYTIGITLFSLFSKIHYRSISR